jgi:hypothetical protein
MDVSSLVRGERSPSAPPAALAGGRTARCYAAAVALALVLILAGVALWVLALVGLIRDRRSALWNRVVVGLLLVALPPAATIYWLRH